MGAVMVRGIWNVTLQKKCQRRGAKAKTKAITGGKHLKMCGLIGLDDLSDLLESWAYTRLNERKPCQKQLDKLVPRPKSLRGRQRNKKKLAAAATIKDLKEKKQLTPFREAKVAASPVAKAEDTEVAFDAIFAHGLTEIVELR